MKYYFTFGSDPRFPFDREDYVLVVAPTSKKAREAFKAEHPNRPGSPYLNCADIYDEINFEVFVRKYYGDREPVQVIIAT